MVNTDEIQVGSRSLVRRQDDIKRSVLFYTLRRFKKSQRQGGPGRRGQKGGNEAPPLGSLEARVGSIAGRIRRGFRARRRHTGRSQSGVGDPSERAGCLAGPRRQPSVGRVHQSGGFARGAVGIPSRAFAEWAPPYAPGASRRGEPGSGPGRRGHAGACGAWRCGCSA